MDVVFLLLCFFVTSQIFAQWETEIDVTLPTAETGEVPQRLPGEVIVNVLPDGRTVVNGQTLEYFPHQFMGGRGGFGGWGGSAGGNNGGFNGRGRRG